MTDNEIIKALSTVTYGGHSCTKCKHKISKGEERCGFKGCNIARNALSLINCQKAEIERLKELNAVLETDNFNANMNLEHIQYEFDLLNQEKSVVIAEAVKEFAERAKGKLARYIEKCGDFVPYGMPDIIDNLVKEMTEDEGK